MRRAMPIATIESRIHLVRGIKVMLDEDLARLYGVQTKALNQAVRRNESRFPPDFMFRLTVHEASALRSQFVTLEPGRGRHRKYPPLAFTEQGVAMLSSVLRSERAVRVNIEIMRAFVRLRILTSSHASLARKIAALESRYDAQFKIVFDAIRRLIAPPKRPRSPIGFRFRESSPQPYRTHDRFTVAAGF
jgi:hypothetical protein